MPDGCRSSVSGGAEIRVARKKILPCPYKIS
jgi:hypothetical protein